MTGPYIRTRILVDKVDQRMADLGLDGEKESVWVDFVFDVSTCGSFRAAIDNEGTCIYTCDGEYFGNVECSIDQILSVLGVDFESTSEPQPPQP